MDSIPKMRTLPELAAEIAEKDPDTKLTLPVIRRMIKAGIIPALYSGNRALVDASRLGEYLSADALVKRPEVNNGIRRVGI